MSARFPLVALLVALSWPAHAADLDPSVMIVKREADLQFSDEVQHEDLGICEDVQRGLASGSYIAGRLNPLRESAVHHFQELLRTAYREVR